MDEDFYLEDVEDEMEDEEDLTGADEELELAAVDEDFVIETVDDDLTNAGAKSIAQTVDHMFASSNANTPTLKLTKMAMKVFFQFLWSRGIEINLETCTKTELATTLKQFFLKVRKSDGEMYKKDSFGSIKFGLIRGIKEIRNDFNFAFDKEFVVAMQAFKQTLRKLRCLGKTADHIEKIASVDLEKLYKSDTFNTNRPSSLQYKVFFEILFFLTCSKGRRNLRNLNPSHVIIKQNKNGRKYVQILDCLENIPEHADTVEVGRSTECRTKASDRRPKGGLIFELPGNPLCPVAAIEKYLSKLPKQCTFFFPQPADRQRCVKGNDQGAWYLNAALGKNSLGAMMREISKQAELSKGYSNSCIHATSTSALTLQGYDVKNYLEKMEMMSSGGQNNSEESEIMLEKMSDVLSKTIFGEKWEDSTDIDLNNSSCEMYLVPMQNPTEEQPKRAIPTISTQQLTSMSSPNIQILSVQPANLTSQSLMSNTFQSIRPQTTVQNSVRIAVPIQPFPTRNLLQKKIQMILPSPPITQTPVITNFVRPVTIPQVVIKTEPSMDSCQVSTYPDFTSKSWTMSSPSSTGLSVGSILTSSQQGTSLSMPTTVSQISSTNQQTTYGHFQKSVLRPITIHESELQVNGIPSNSDDSSNNQPEMDLATCCQQYERKLQLKEEKLQATKQKLDVLEVYQGEYKRLLQESTVLQQHLDASRTKNKELQDKIEKLKKAKQNDDSSFEHMCCNKFLFRHYTGYMPEEFQILFQFLITESDIEPFKGCCHSLSLRTQLLLTLYKLRNNFTFIDLGQRFNVSTITAKNIFSSWLNHMSLKFEEVYIWPHRNTLRAQVPRHFQQDFPNTIALFKCVKIKISQSGKNKQDSQEASKKSSSLRHGILVVSSRGCVIGCSGLVSGNVTDSDLFQKSGLKNELKKYIESGRLQAGDGILAENLDVGLDLGELGLKLNDVAFSKCYIDDDLKAVLQKQRVETHKVMVDKTVCRLKNFKIMSQTIPSCLSASCDKIFQVTAFLTNFLPPLSFDV